MSKVNSALKERAQEEITGYLFILPAVLIFLLFIFGPVLVSIMLSFSEYDMFSPPRFVGNSNFQKMLEDNRLWQTFFNTLKFTILAVTGNVGLGLLLGVAINQRLPQVVKKIFRTVYFFPVMISYVFASLIFAFLYHPDLGIINYYLGLIDIGSIPWLNSRIWVWVALLILDIWKNVGFFMILTLAALQNIPDRYYEVASIDGASRFKQFLHVTLPLVTPTLFFNISIATIGALKVFDVIFVLTNGGPGDATRSVAMYIYEKAFQSLEMGYASAVGLILFMFIMLVTLIQFITSRYWINYDM